jgi:uncharacterized protein YecE (DUF72 family)
MTGPVLLYHRLSRKWHCLRRHEKLGDPTGRLQDHVFKTGKGLIPEILNGLIPSAARQKKEISLASPVHHAIKKSVISVKVPAHYRPFLRIGTCSWKYDSWKGLVYDKGKSYRPDDYLVDYARIFNTVEADQWFWSLFPGGIKLPEPAVARRYAASVPDDFVFTVKAPNSLTLTHYYDRETSGSLRGKPNPHFLDGELLVEFLDRLAPLRPKLGPVMFQFEYLNRQKMPNKEAFFERFADFISGAPKGYQYAIEIRNPNYLSPAFFEFLKQHGLGFVYLEGYFMPPIGEVLERFKPVPAPFSVIRLQGGDRADIEAETGAVWNKIISPKPERVEDAVRIVRHNTRSKVLTYLNLNNHFEGSAPLTAERFLETLRTEP